MIHGLINLKRVQQPNEKQKRNSLGCNNPVQYWTWKLLTGWWDSRDCRSWEKWAQLDCTLKDSCEPSQYEVQFYKESDIITWKSCQMWNVHGERQVENFKKLENYAKLTTQKLFEGYFVWIWSRFEKKCS